jgi:glycosyltransferase involved in cell wall biosynthesis
MSAGCALIASATAPVREVVRHGENGRLVDFFDVDALSAEVVNALADPDACREMRARARQTIVADFDLETRCLPSMLNYLLGEDHDAVGSNGDS